MNIDGSDEKYWVVYLPKINISFVADRDSQTILYADTGKGAQERRLQEQAQRQKHLESAFSSWDGSHRAVTKLVKESMHDPDSYKHVSTKYWDRGDHLIVITEFRGKNAYGGTVKNTVKVKVDLDGNVLEVLK